MPTAKDVTMSAFGLTGALTGIASLAVTGAIVGSSLSGPSGSDTVVDAPSGQDLVYTLDGTEVERITQVACTATGGLTTYDTCYMPSPLTTTGALKSVSIQCGNVAKALPSDLGFVKAANSATGAALPNFNNVSLGTGATFFYGTGYTIWNPADKLKLGTLTAPTGALNTTRYNCIMRAVVEDIYGR